MRCEANECRNLWQQQDARIDYLRRRIHFHCEKMRLVIDRLSVDLLTNVDANTDDLVGYAEEQALVHEDLQEQLQRIFIALTGGSHNGYGPEPPNARFASPAIEQRFEDWLRVGRPSDLLAGLPLRDAFDAILSTYGQCIELRAQQPLKHLLLLKCMWLILRTKQGIQYQEARPAHYYRRAINRVERGLRMMMRSAQVQVFDEDILLSLPKESFKIWLDPVPAAITALLEPKPQSPLPMEQFVCRLDLAGDGVLPTPSVTVYQRTRHNFRIIKEWWSRDGARITIPQQVCALEDALIPRYALPSSGSSALNLAIYGRHELMDYSFRNLSDLESFQAALVGQDVAHDQTGVGCEFGVRMNAMACDGRVQLWQEPITSRPHAITGTLLDPISDRSTSVDGWSDSTSRRPSIAHSIAQTSTTTSTLEGWISEDIKLPALVIYAQLRSEKPKGQFAIIYILLIDGIDVDYNKCDCGEHYDTCPRLVLSGHKKHGIPIRIIYTGSPHLDNPDPYAFDIFPVRVPRSRGFDRIEVQTTKNVLFNFRNAGLPAKEAFDTALRERFTVRDRQRSNAVETERILRHRADRPSPRSRRSSSSAWPLDFGVVFTNDSRGHGIRLPQAQEEQAEGDFGRSEGAGARPSSHSHQQENAASPHPSTPVQPRVDRRAHVSEDNETVPGHNNEQPDDGLLLSPTSDPEPALSQRSGNSILPPQNGSNSSSGYSDNSGIPTASYNPTALFPRGMFSS